MRLVAMRCTKKLKQNGGVGVTLHFHSADMESMAILVCPQEEADKFQLGAYYDFEANPQVSRFMEGA